MRNLLRTAALAVAVVTSMPGAGQTGAAIVGSGPGVAGAAQTVKVTATITAIDQATREVTLKGPRGREVALVAGPEVKNFARMKVGDQVSAEYIESLTLELRKGGGNAIGVTAQAGAMAAKPGERPAGVAGEQVRIVADVIDVDPSTQTLTLRGAKETVELKVRDPEQFKLVAKGDQVEATYTRALAIAVEPVKPAGN